MSDNITLRELQERLSARRDPDEIVELLNVSSEELVEAFPDKIEEYYDELVPELFDEFGEEGDAY